MAKVIVSDSGGEREVALDKDVLAIGRVAQDNDIEIKVAEASRHHCRLVREGKAWFVEDLDSSNGTRVNGRRVTKFELADGDEIQVGVATLRFLESDAVAPAAVEDEIELEISLGDDAWLQHVGGDRDGERIEVTGRTSFGRRSTCDVVLDERGVSSVHAELVHEGGDWVVRDLGSTNGVFVDGEKVGEAALKPGSRLRIGTVTFHFGIGDDAGVGDLAAALAPADTGAGREVFAISEANLKKKQRTALFAWLVIFGLAAVGVWLWLSGETAGEKRREPPLRISGNMLVRGSSFEVSDELEDYLYAGSDALDYEEVQGEANSGDWALALDATGESGTHELLFVDPIANLAPAERLEIGAHVDASGLRGGAGGLCLVWLDEAGRRIGASYLNVSAADRGLDERRGAFTAPEGARAAQAGLAVTDASGSMLVDDVFVVRRSGDMPGAVAAAGFEATLDPSGVFTLSRDNAEVAARGGIWLRDEAGALAPSFARFVGAGLTDEGGAVVVDGEIAHDGGRHPLRLRVEPTDVGLRWSGEVKGLPAERVVLAFEIPSDEGIVTLGRAGTIRHVEGFTRAAADSIVLGAGARAAQFRLGAPTDVAMTVERGRGRVVLPLAAGEGERLGFDVAIQLDFEGERGESTAVFEAAERADLVDRAHGKAMTGYREVIDRFPYRRDLVTRAEGRLAELAAEGDRVARELAQRAARIAFFGTYARDHARFSADAAEAAGRFEGVPVADTIRELVAELERKKADSDREERLARAQNHLLRGQDLMTEGRSMPVLARGFFLSVIALAPDSEWAETARAELERIAPITGR